MQSGHELETYTPDEWTEDLSIVEGSRKNRKRVVRDLEKSCNLEISAIVGEVKAGRLSPYHVSKKYVDSMRGRLAPLTMQSRRTILAVMWETVLPQTNFSRRAFDRLVPMGATYNSVLKLIPPREKVVEILKTANPKPRALIGGLACSGMRISEWLSRRWTDLEVRPEGHARVRLLAAETKSRWARYAFLTSEIVEWLNGVRTKSPFLFPGDNQGHIWYASAQFQVKEAFARVGLLDRPGERFTVHSFRTFADAELRACGLDGKYVSATIGHRNKLQSEASYLSWEAIEKAWVEKCASKMRFLDTTSVDRQKMEKLEKTNGKLELLLERLLEKLV